MEIGRAKRLDQEFSLRQKEKCPAGLGQQEPHKMEAPSLTQWRELEGFGGTAPDRRFRN